MKNKICSKCRRNLPVSEYYRENNGTKLGVHSSCKECCREYGKNANKKNPQKNILRNRAWKKKNPDKVYRWYQEHKQEVSAKRRERREKLKKELGEEYYKPLRQKSREIRRAARLRFLDMYGNKCVCCGESNKGFLTIEHINGIGVPSKNRPPSHEEYVKAAKEYRPELYEILCYNCNIGKSKNGGTCPHEDWQ